MKNKNTRISVTLFALALSVLLAGCSSSPTLPTPPAKPESIDYRVQRGDRLSDIALQFAGDQAHWRTIAEYNNIENPRKLREGALLKIPAALILDDANTSVANIPTSTVPSSPEVSPSLAMKKAQDVETGVILTPIPKRPQFELSPIQTDNRVTNAQSIVAGQEIKVIGSYYPKGIYTAPQTSSQLMLRATPGTIFMLGSTIDGWFKIETDRGTGFIRHADATLLNQ